MSGGHTPGPWETWQAPGTSWWTVRAVYHDDMGRRVTAYPAICNAGMQPNGANARLIAAAPELLEALKQVVSVADRKTVEFDLARAAIAKATKAEGTP